MADQPASKATNGTVPENNVGAKVAPIFLPEPSSSEKYIQPTEVTNGIQPFMNLAVKPEQLNVQPSDGSVDSPETVKPATAWQPEPTTNYSADHTAKIDMTNQPTTVHGDNWQMSLDKNYIKAGQNATLTVNYQAQAGDTFVLDIGYPAGVNAQPLNSQIGTTSTKDNGLRTQVTNVFKQAGTYTQVIKLNGWKKSAEGLGLLRHVFGDQAFDLTLKRGTSVENAQDVGRLYLTSSFTPIMSGDGSVGVDRIDAKYVPVLSTNNNYIFTVRTNWSDSGTLLDPSYNGDFVYSISVPKTFELDQTATEALYQQIKNNELRYRWGIRGSNVTVNQAGVGAPVVVKANALDWIGWHYNSNEGNSNEGVSFLGHFVDAPSVATMVTSEGQTTVSDAIGGHTQTISLPGLSAKVINAANYNYADSEATVFSMSDYGDHNQLYRSHEVPMTGSDNPITLINDLSILNNSPFDVKNATITLNFGDGLHVDVDSVRNNSYISNLLVDNDTHPNREKSLLVTYQDGTSETVPANSKGDPAKNIKSITLTRDWNAGQMAGMHRVGLHGGGIYGFVASTYQDGSPVKVGDTINVSLTVAGVDTAGHKVSKTVSDTLKVVDQQFAPLTTESFWGSIDKKGLGDDPSGTINLHWKRISGERGKIQLENPTLYFVMPNTVSQVKNPRWGIQKDVPGNSAPTLTSITYEKSKDGKNTVAIMHFSGALIDQALNNYVPLYFDTVNKDNVINQSSEGYLYWTADNVNADGLTKIDPSRLDSQNKAAHLPADLTQEQLDKIYLHSLYWGKIDMATGIYSTSATKMSSTPWRTQTIMDYHGDGQADVGVNLVNDTSNALHNVVAIINLPKATNSSSLTVNLTGNTVELIDPNADRKLTADATVLYSTKAADLSSNDLSSFVTADQIEDWSKVQAVSVILQNLGVMTSRQVQIPVVVNDLVANAGKVGTVGIRISADELKPIIVSADAKNAAKLVVGGQATIHAQMHYQDAQGKDHYVPLADSTHAYDILQNHVLNASDFIPSATDLAQVPGYELSKASPTVVSGNAVIGQPVSAQDDGSVLQFELVPSVRKVLINYVDDDDNQKVVQTNTLTGRYGDTVDLKLTVPDKYQLADGQQLPTTYTFTKGSGDVTIHLKHQVVQREATIDLQLVLVTSVHFDDDNVDQSVVTQAQWNQLDDELKSHVPGPHDILDPLVKVGMLMGHVNYDLVDNRVVSFGDDWTTLNLGGRTYQLPNGTDVVNGIVDDYAVSFGKKLKSVILADYPNVDPDYVNRPWHGYLSVNTTNNSDDFVAKAIRMEGLQAGLAGDEPNALAKATGDRAATTVEISNKPIDLNLAQHHLLEFSEQNGQLRAKAFLPVAGVYIPYVEKTATRTINVTMPDGKTTTVKQTATLAKQVDFSNGAHPTWTTDEWASYDVPAIPGYTVSQSNVAKETVTSTTEDQTVNITYTANDQQMTITFYDQDGKKVTDKVIKGTTGSTIPVGDLIPDGWELYDGQNVPTDITFKAHNDNQDFVIKHVLSLVSADNIPVAGSVIKGTKAKTYPEGLTRDMLTKTITRTIQVMKDGHQVGTKTQRVTFLRNAVVDAVTGSVKTLSWSEDGSHVFTAYQPASIEGYTVDGAKAMTVSPLNEASTTVIVNYKAVPQALNVIYQTSDGQQVGSTVSMVADKDGQIDLTSQLPSGYELATPVQKTSVSDLHVNNYYVTVKPQLKIYTSEDADIPSGVYLTKVVNRTINITLPNGKRKTINQTVNFNRMVTIDANGNSTYTDWKAVGTDTFDGVRLPVRHGYKLVFDDGSNGIKAQQVTNAETANDVVINVSYVKA